MFYSIKNIKVNNEIVAKVFKYRKKKFKGIKFFTPNTDNLQVGLMSHPKGHIIQPHFHKNTKKIIKHMSELLILYSGKLQVFFYNKKNKKIKSIILNKKDMILLIKGSHGFKTLKKTEMLEIKQGPFLGDKDKIRLKNFG
ncbi:WbuC family cupin fold metalloprotein [Candidatus Pelagibacter sp. HIMB1746]|uniref:WbuC family cupin fold metalloprotein n=1 Tax=Candidatus Pelagibacter sp. HIMB1746 TaxID=3413370 RepID=UPI003F82710C